MRFFLILFFLGTSYLHAQQDPWLEVEFELNEGEKWKVSPLMLPHLEASERLLLESKPKNLAATRKLYRKLWKISDRIAETCEVEGEGHPYFHAWYVPYYKHLEHLRDELFYEDALTIIDELKNGFTLYHRYFE